MLRVEPGRMAVIRSISPCPTSLRASLTPDIMCVPDYDDYSELGPYDTLELSDHNRSNSMQFLASTSLEKRHPYSRFVGTKRGK
jgi:hypothetical protein